MATRKQKRYPRSPKVLKSVKNRKSTPYPKMHKSYMNISETWVNGQGRRNIVAIQNGKGTKRVERLGSGGEVLGMQNRSLSPPERKQILEGTFVPGLWRNCQLGQC